MQIYLYFADTRKPSLTFLSPESCLYLWTSLSSQDEEQRGSNRAGYYPCCKSISFWLQKSSLLSLKTETLKSDQALLEQALGHRQQQGRQVLPSRRAQSCHRSLGSTWSSTASPRAGSRVGQSASRHSRAHPWAGQRWTWQHERPLSRL